VCCAEVEGHTMWRRMVGKYLAEIGAPGILKEEVNVQVHIQEQERKEDVDATFTPDRPDRQ